jgi:hypothetical protein
MISVRMYNAALRCPGGRILGSRRLVAFPTTFGNIAGSQVLDGYVLGEPTLHRRLTEF